MQKSLNPQAPDCQKANRHPGLHAAVVRRADRQDAALLVSLGRRAFYEAFAERTDPADMAAYLEANFVIDAFEVQLKDRDTLYLIVEIQENAVGYACLSPTRTPRCVAGPGSIQLIRFYLLKKFYGQGVGNSLMCACLDESRQRGYRAIWLSSWESNGRANAFYRKWGFRVVGRQKFVVGSDVQKDFIFQRKLSGRK